MFEYLKSIYRMNKKYQTINIILAENDDYGDPSGKVHRIDFEIDDEIALSIEPANFMDGEPIFTTDIGGITMYGCTCKTEAREYWTGNRMNNQYPTPAGYAIGFINMLSKSKKFIVSEGWSTLYYKFKKGEEITAADFDLDPSIQPQLLIP